MTARQHKQRRVRADRTRRATTRLRLLAGAMSPRQRPHPRPSGRWLRPPRVIETPPNSAPPPTGHRRRPRQPPAPHSGQEPPFCHGGGGSVMPVAPAPRAGPRRAPAPRARVACTVPAAPAAPESIGRSSSVGLGLPQQKRLKIFLRSGLVGRRHLGPRGARRASSTDTSTDIAGAGAGRTARRICDDFGSGSGLGLGLGFGSARSGPVRARARFGPVRAPAREPARPGSAPARPGSGRPAEAEARPPRRPHRRPACQPPPPRTCQSRSTDRAARCRHRRRRCRRPRFRLRRHHPLFSPFFARISSRIGSGSTNCPTGVCSNRPHLSWRDLQLAEWRRGWPPSPSPARRRAFVAPRAAGGARGRRVARPAGADAVAMMSGRRMAGDIRKAVEVKLPLMNAGIDAPELRVVVASADGKDEMLGILPRDEALARAEAGVDLVLISPDADPPVAKIIDYGKLRYQEEKKKKANALKSKASELKEIKMSYKIASATTAAAARAEKFLKGGQRVKAHVQFKGREQQHMSRQRPAPEAHDRPHRGRPGVVAAATRARATAATILTPGRAARGRVRVAGRRPRLQQYRTRRATPARGGGGARNRARLNARRHAVARPSASRRVRPVAAPRGRRHERARARAAARERQHVAALALVGGARGALAGVELGPAPPALAVGAAGDAPRPWTTRRRRAPRPPPRAPRRRPATTARRRTGRARSSTSRALRPSARARALARAASDARGARASAPGAAPPSSPAGRRARAGRRRRRPPRRPRRRRARRRPRGSTARSPGSTRRADREAEPAPRPPSTAPCA